MSSSAEIAVATFKSGFNCSQSVLSVFCEKLGLDRGTAAKMASGFGGGIGHMAKTCGAVTGAIMVIGLKSGMSMEDSPYKSNKLVYALVNSFVAEFVERNHSIECRELLGCDISDKDTYDEARKKGLFFSVCPKYVSDAVDILESMFEQNGRE
jgi:C_GCAxxG_C_C family probable redox protein